MGGSVTDDVRFLEVPKMTVCALRFTTTARARIIKAGGECLTLDQLALRSPEGENTVRLPTAREIERFMLLPIISTDQPSSLHAAMLYSLPSANCLHDLSWYRSCCCAGASRIASRPSTLAHLVCLHSFICLACAIDLEPSGPSR